MRDHATLRAPRNPDRPGLDRDAVRARQGRMATPEQDQGRRRTRPRTRTRPGAVQHRPAARRHRLRHSRRRAPRPRRSPPTDPPRRRRRHRRAVTKARVTQQRSCSGDAHEHPTGRRQGTATAGELLCRRGRFGARIAVASVPGGRGLVAEAKSRTRGWKSCRAAGRRACLQTRLVCAGHVHRHAGCLGDHAAGRG